VQQAEDFKRILTEEKESFEKVNHDLQAQFSSQLKEIPMLEQKLADVAEIPHKIDDMIARLEQSNSQLYSNFLFSTRETLLQFAKASKENNEIVRDSSSQTTHRTSWIVIVCAILIAIACTANTIHNIWFSNNPVPALQQQDDNYFSASDSTANDSIIVDSVAIFKK
jgi:predicted nuclease with TOPRIM domain